jgi:hypothetical protein
MAEIDTLKHKIADMPRAGTPEALVATITVKTTSATTTSHLTRFPTRHQSTQHTSANRRQMINRPRWILKTLLLHIPVGFL